MPTNEDIAKVLGEIGEYLAMQDVPFKPRAYEKVAETIRSLSESVSEMYKKGGLSAVKNIPGVGASIAESIEEFIKKGKIAYHEELKRGAPVNLAELRRVEGLGPRKIKILYQKLGIRTLSDLKKAATSHKIRSLEGFGEKTEDNILKGIEFVNASGDRKILGFILPDIRVIEDNLKKIKGVSKVVVAGSTRRRRETIGDIDFLVVSEKSEPVMDFFVNMPEVARIMAKGPTKSMVHLKSGLDADIRVVPKESYGAALNYFTGSKDHNVALRKLAIEKGYKLNEYGLFKIKGKGGGEEKIAGDTEEGIYKALGLPYIEPELREMMGEIEAAKSGKLPKLIDYKDLKGDLQVQTSWTDGSASIEEMAIAAYEQGLSYMVVTDHTKRLAMTHGLDDESVLKQGKEIDKVNQKLKEKKIKFYILKGTECDILKDGSLDLSDKVLATLDVVGVSVHSYFNLPINEQTKRVEKAIRNKNVDIFFHPTGRLINKRSAYEIDMERIIKVAGETGTVLEIDAYPDRLDMNYEYIRQCVESGVKMSIDSDAHATTHFQYLEFGIDQARRGWAEKEDIINAWPMEKMLSMLKGETND